MMLAHLTVLASTLLGWSDITVTHLAGANGPIRPSSATSPGSTGPANARPRRSSGSTSNDLIAETPMGVIASLAKLARDQPDPDLVYAIAELSWVEGMRLDRRRKAAAIDRFLDIMAYSYYFLFDADPRMAAGRAAFGPSVPARLRAVQRRLELPDSCAAQGADVRIGKSRPKARSRSRPTAASKSCARLSASLALEARRYRPVVARERLRGDGPGNPIRLVTAWACR